MDVTIRAFASAQDIEACTALQASIWGPRFADAVPASLLQVATYVGGLALGAFATDGTLLGFVFSLAGMRDGQPVHWSHMLGVRESAQGMGIGRRLKEAQRDELARRGVARMFWTFDPLQARNAHLNLNRLGVQVLEYVPNMYGITDSPLHFRLATDRLIVECRTAARGPATSPNGAVALGTLPVLTPFPRSGDPPPAHGTNGAPAVLIEIPADLSPLTPESAGQWRVGTRAHFQQALAAGYTVAALERDPAAGRAFYVLTAPGGAEARER
jgi:predicted GNAT superfamily acetyltransferase